MIWGLSVLFFLSVILAAIGLRQILFPGQENPRSAVKRRLASLGPSDSVAEAAAYALMRQTSLSSIGVLDRLLAKLPRTSGLQDLLRQAGNPFNMGTMVLLSGTLAVMGLLVSAILGLGLVGLLAMVVGAYLPIVILRRIKAKRLSVFEEQFPDAVDLMARAIRAGHSFSSALRMVADEMGEPISGEFSKVFEDYSFGKTMEDALTDLVKRIELNDVKFFATAVTLQRETGGNLTEILDNMGYIIRERFRLLRTVKALSAEGRLSGIILSIMAPALLGILWLTSPGYIKVAFEHPIGQMVLIIGGVFELLGILIIKKLIALDV